MNKKESFLKQEIDLKSPNRNIVPISTSIGIDGKLSIGGCSIEELVKKYNSPLYILDETTLRKSCKAYKNALKKYYPGCEKARLRNFGMSIGIRDTRKLDAVYNMTELDVRKQGKFEDTIGIYPEFIDGYGLLILPTTGRYMELPYSAMLPKNINGLLVTGRATGGDKISHAATRNMSCCSVNGQGAGIAAATAVKSNRDVRNVNISNVQKEIKKQGVRIN